MICEKGDEIPGENFKGVTVMALAYITLYLFHSEEKIPKNSHI